MAGDAIKHDWSHVLGPRGVQLMDALEGIKGAGPPVYQQSLAWGVDGAKQGSPNHEAQAWGIEAARAVAAKVAKTNLGLSQASQQFDTAKAVLLEAYFPRELARGPRGVGLWASEQFAPDAHGGQHLNGTSFARLAAWLSRDPELLALSEELVLTTVRALLCVCAVDYTVWAPGMRASATPTASAATAWLQTALSHGQLRPKQRLDPFYLQVRVLEYLRKAGDPLLARTATMTHADAAPCVLKFPMNVKGFSGGYVAFIPKPTGKLPPPPVCNWVQVDGGGQRVTGGQDWKTDGPQGLNLNGPYNYSFPGIGQK